MRYRLVEIANTKFLTLDEDLTQTPVAKCDDTFASEKSGNLYSGGELTLLNMHDEFIVRLKYKLA